MGTDTKAETSGGDIANAGAIPEIAGRCSVRLSAAAAGRTPYAPPALRGPVDLFLDANEGPASSLDLGAIVASLPPDVCRRYPDAAPLEQQLARSLNLATERVIVTAGGDDAIDRVCRACLEPGRTLVLPVPTFEMIPRTARLMGARVVTTPWRDGPYPTDAVLALIDSSTSLIAIVSPNNPTGAVATASDLRRLAAAAPQAILLVDLAYTEFADEDLTSAALEIPGAIIVRTFSKALGLAGLRVGYALGDPRLIHALRAVGAPYPVSALSLAVAAAVLPRAEERKRQASGRIGTERRKLETLLSELGGEPRASQANFVLAEFGNARWVWEALGGLGISVRRFATSPGLERSLRITCPGSEPEFDRLCRGLRAALRPEALLFDMDGVLADVSASYRAAITLTAGSYGVVVTPGDIAHAKAAGNANNDWVLTQRLLARSGVVASLGEVTDRFERFYQGESGKPGLRETESLIPDRGMLESLASQFPLGIVTGRPARDCQQFLNRYEIADLFRVVVCMEDAPAKPDTAPVRLAMERLGARAAWMIGDTPDDITAARGAGVVPIGFAPPGADAASLADILARYGAARTLTGFSELLELLT